MKISKKAEKLARALIAVDLFYIGFPEERVQSRIDEAWSGQLPQAQDVICAMNNIEDFELDGETTQEEIDMWRDSSKAL